MEVWTERQQHTDRQTGGSQAGTLAHTETDRHARTHARTCRAGRQTDIQARSHTD